MGGKVFQVDRLVRRTLLIVSRPDDEIPERIGRDSDAVARRLGKLQFRS